MAKTCVCSGCDGAVKNGKCLKCSYRPPVLYRNIETTADEKWSHRGSAVAEQRGFEEVTLCAVNDYVYAFVPSALSAREAKELLASANIEGHLVESESREVAVLREAALMYASGLRLVARGLGLPEELVSPARYELLNYRETMKKVTAAPCQDVVLLRSGVQLVTDAYLADSRCAFFENKLCVGLLTRAHELNQHGDIAAFYDPLSTSVFSYTAMCVAAQLASGSRENPYLVKAMAMLDSALELFKDDVTDKRWARSQLYLYRMYHEMKRLKSCDLEKVHSYMENALKAADCQGAWDFKISMLLRAGQFPAVKKEILGKKNHHDDEHVHGSLYVLAAISDDGLPHYERAREAQRRFEYLFGRPTKESKPDSAISFLTHVAHHKYGSSVGVPTIAELRKFTVIPEKDAARFLDALKAKKHEVVKVLKKDDFAVVEGLQSEGGRRWNGCICRIDSELVEGRHQVTMVLEEKQQCLKVKPSNLRRPRSEKETKVVRDLLAKPAG